VLPAEIGLPAFQAQVPLPCLAYLDQEHFVVVYAARRGRLMYSSAEFAAKWQLPDAQSIVLLPEPMAQLTEVGEEPPAQVPEIDFACLLVYVRPYWRLW
jgi:hypothetical protein